MREETIFKVVAIDFLSLIKRVTRDSEQWLFFHFSCERSLAHSRRLRATGTCYMLRAQGSPKARKATRNNTAGRLTSSRHTYSTYTLRTNVREGATLTCSRDRVTTEEEGRRSSKKRTNASRQRSGEKGSARRLSRDRRLEQG